MACSSCAIYHKLDSLATAYSHKSFDVVAASSIKLYGSVVTLWILWQLGINWLYRGDIDKVDLLQYSFAGCIKQFFPLLCSIRYAQVE